ncbi:MAG: hypothetical protein JKY60_20355 [Kordiimonadaceae bacterium]|nr:hypothetical protein [Kordiimonadaceae bacterium]
MIEPALNTRLSPHFVLSEMVASAVAKGKGLNNVPREECDLANLKALCLNVLEPIRDSFGRPVIITSGFRCCTLNRLIGGAPNSQHTMGEAADFIIKSVPAYDAAKAIRYSDQVDFDQLIYESRISGKTGKVIEWVHVSHSRGDNNRRECLTIAFDADGEKFTKGDIHTRESMLFCSG